MAGLVKRGSVRRRGDGLLVHIADGAAAGDYAIRADDVQRWFDGATVRVYRLGQGAEPADVGPAYLADTRRSLTIRVATEIGNLWFWVSLHHTAAHYRRGSLEPVDLLGDPDAERDLELRREDERRAARLPAGVRLGVV